MLCKVDKVMLVLCPRNVVKLLTSNSAPSHNQKKVNWSAKDVGGRPAPDQTTKKIFEHRSFIFRRNFELSVEFTC